MDPISFNLPALVSGSIYRINQALLSVTVELVKKDGNKPADASKVALGNAMNVFYLKCKVTKYFFYSQ